MYPDNIIPDYPFPSDGSPKIGQDVPFFTQPYGRWQCPDCRGWVAESVPVHYCDITSTTTNRFTIYTTDTTSPTPDEGDMNDGPEG